VTRDELVNALLGDKAADVAEGLIPQLIDVLPSDAVFALYLRCSWGEEFEDAAPRRFRAPEGKKQVPTMRLVAQLGYASSEDWQVVTLPAWVARSRSTACRISRC
jgi:serine protease inhibitor